MFERFTATAREVVVHAQVEARVLNHGHIGTEHLLLAFFAVPDSVAAKTLTELGLTHDKALASIKRHVGRDELDADALGSIGIDLDAVREKIEGTFGPGALDRPRGSAKRVSGHIPFSPGAKKVLELSLREAVHLKHKALTDGHILLGLLREGEGVAMKVIAETGIDPTTLRNRLTPKIITNLQK
jgi:ATP-dependent Clp protease ATP-binding subunit ClpA